MHRRCEQTHHNRRSINQIEIKAIMIYDYTPTRKARMKVSLTITSVGKDTEHLQLTITADWHIKLYDPFGRV